VTNETGHIIDHFQQLNCHALV